MVNLGMKVVGVSRKSSLGATQQDDIFASQKGQTDKMFFMQGDVTKPNDISRIIKWTRDKFGRTDVLVNAAGSFQNYEILSCDQLMMKKMAETRMLGTLLFSRAIILDMKSTKIKNGHIITISSVRKQDLRSYALVHLATQECVSSLTSVLKNEVERSELPIRVTEIPIPRNLVDENKKGDKNKDFQWPNISAEDVAKVVGVSRKLIGTPKRNEEGHTGEMIFVQGDVTNLGDINKILKWTRKEFGRTDVLVNAAGLYHNFTITSSNPTALKKMYETNVTATLLFSRAAILEMMANRTKNGHIITISSLVGKQDMSAFSGAYLATHETVRQLSEILNAEVRESLLPITVSNIPPLRLEATKPEDYIPVREVTAEDIAKEICHAVSIDHPLLPYF
ncbi:Hypothetical predicted protein [Cloeon dipterum]|uniref:Uncharacterized protein n=1 Tax=Cloeon dipterum TaxID=197152 RepID=A0A8S1CTP7_9INSE|nr:Hypothetical predicted protein [Cloeon dipterum]